MNPRPSQVEAAPLDVLIVGAGMSGIGMACTLAREMPQKTYMILEARERLGGTWDLFKYPGIRSDSDLYTFAYDFKPWQSRNAIAGADEILDYLREAVAEYGVGDRIRYRQKVVAAEWSSAAALWSVRVASAETNEETTIRARWLFGATGYYDYDQGYRPAFPHEEDFKGSLIHPQAWPEDFEVKGKRIAVIGSGATAVTLVPALAAEAEHVTQIQRTPSYVLPIPKEDGLANLARRFLSPERTHRIVRRKNILRQKWVWALCQRYPDRARKIIRWANRKSLPENYPVDVHFNPPYGPWDQRLCAVPDGDLFKEIKAGRVSIVTGTIDRFTATGVRMASGEEIPADVIVTATGLRLKLFGGVGLSVDGTPVVAAERIVFKGAMLDGVPNFCFAVGYTNSSWTLKIGLLCRWFCRLLAEMDARGDAVCVAERPPGETGARALLDFGAGYVKRSLHELPRQGSGPPWVMSRDYIADERLLTRGPVLDPAMRLAPAPSAPLPNPEKVA